MSAKEINLARNHKFLSSANDIRQISSPLEYLNVHMFVYRRRYSDGSEIYLGTDANWIEDYFRLGLYQSSLFEAEIERYPNGFLPWPKERKLDVFIHGQQYYNSFSGITYCHQQDQFCELFFFSSGREISQFSGYYEANMDLLQRFVFYFKEKACQLINECALHVVNPPKVARDSSVDMYLNSLANHYKKPREQFLKFVEKDRLSDCRKQYQTLTVREKDCLALLVQLHSLPKIGQILGISHRTVESHIANIKDKLQCRTSIELILKVNKLQEC